VIHQLWRAGRPAHLILIGIARECPIRLDVEKTVPQGNVPSILDTALEWVEHTPMSVSLSFNHI